MNAPIDIKQVQELIRQGENASVEFKTDEVTPMGLAKEMVAFANTRGGTILIGVTNEGTIEGVHRENIEEWITNIARHTVIPGVQPQISTVKLEGKTVVVVEISRGVHKPYQTIDGKFWIRVGSTNRTATKEELSRLFQQAGLVQFDLSPVEGDWKTDLDPVKLHHYWSTYYDVPYEDLGVEEQFTILKNADIIVEWEERYVPSVGGLLIFGKHPQRRLPHAAIVFAVFDGVELTDDLTDKKEIEGTLPEQIDHTASLIELFLPRPSTVEGLKREEKVLIPRKVIREALVNAVCHRDYSLVNRKTQVYLFRDRLEVTSPGRLSNTLTVEKIRYGNSAPRNHFILKFLENMRYIDGLGRGIPMIIKQMGDRARFEEIGELFRVTLMYTD